MLRLIIADAELQTVPENMARDRAIRNIAEKNHKKPTEMLLDSNYMHTTIDKYFPGESNRRGRPDIIYIFLEVAMESILNKNKMLDVYVHTRGNYIIHINSETKLPRSYNRFQGLIEDLFKKRSINYNGNELLSMREGAIIPFLKNLDGKTVALSPEGTSSSLSTIINQDNLNVIIGGFSQGDYISDIYGNFPAYKIFNEELTIWSVGMEVISQYERYASLLG
ncbi:MAG: ribosome biogenesis protein [Ferroplasma sp. Type II]|uniref:ribosome biogenesis protein n=1 Tax=Ferroplasma sp. TaxID=2591003 RepID=UPI00038955E5|nr:ribosome biogenesis protein [Ferroplasma sp.]EQB73971.1 MAG: ribosome biogenesis protein [Ferroplasma sp. Type II]